MRVIPTFVSVLLPFFLLSADRQANAQEVTPALQRNASQWESLLAAEDSRARTIADLNTLLVATRASDPEIRRIGLRALGRLERPELLDTIAARLRDPVARVRVEAAHALGQSVSRGEPGDARARLLEALAAERDASVMAALAETLGRFRHNNPADGKATLDRLLSLLERSATTATGAARGLFFLARQQAARPAFTPAARAALLRKAVDRSGGNAPNAVHLRTVAAAALVTSGGVQPAALRSILQDGNAYVRREAAAALATVMDTAGVTQMITRALADASPVVRLEAVRAYARRFANARGCAPLLRTAADANAHVSLLSIDLLGTACPSTDAISNRLDSLARALPATGDRWHKATHALVALAARAPQRAAEHLPAFAGHPNFFVRTYAATAATALRDTTLLVQFSRDAHPNVRTAAVQGLRSIMGHGADDVYIAQLTQGDSQLLQAAAAALDSTARRDVAPLLLNAFERTSAMRRETYRDARVALLQRIRQLGNASLVPRLRSYVTDYDPVVAERVADVLQAWTGTRPTPAPTAAPHTLLPTFQEAVTMVRSRIVIHLADSAEVELQLLPFDAPTNAIRFLRLARIGYFDGLTFHRVVPNFVVQGGSPNANEYAGDGPYTRDEVGLENRRGTVGLSTRGRDTGDAQIFINLIDNVRLDHDYTVFARVVRGLEHVDRMLEGAVMRKVEIRVLEPTG